MASDYGIQIIKVESGTEETSSTSASAQVHLPITVIKIENETTDNNNPSESAAQNPWPYLNDFFVLKFREKNNFTFACKLCTPKAVLIKMHRSSLNNVKQHIKRAHPAEFINFCDTIKLATRGKSKSEMRSDSSVPHFAKKPCQRSTSDHLDFVVGAASQATVDRRLEELFVANMIPLDVVESETFENLIKALNPSRSGMTKRTLGGRIVSSYNEMKQYLIRVLYAVEWVATTADCWSAHNKSYLGMTVHWLDPSTRQRQKAVLACIRLKGQLTYEVITQAILSIHYDFYIDKKVTRTTLDNGRNFVKPFVQFGCQADTETLPSYQQKHDDHDMDNECDDTVLSALLKESENEEDLKYVRLADTLLATGLENGLDSSIKLPVHMCAAHKFSLVASIDANAALSDTVFESVYRPAMAKANALWNLHNSNTVAADSIYHELGIRLVVPNAMRWRSNYDSVVVLNSIVDTKGPALYRVMTQLELDTFSDLDVKVLKEYTEVMSVVAKALDKILGDDQAYLGTLLPTVAVTILKLKNLMANGIVHCRRLVDVLLIGIAQRFELIFEDEECQLAAAFHPKFRLTWLEKYDISKVAKVKEAMELKVKETMISMGHDADISSSTSSNHDDSDDFFNDITQSKKCRKSKGVVQDLIETWLESPSKETLTDAAFAGEQVLMNLFIKYNTSIPASAAVGSLFSTGKDMLRAMRASLSDESLDMSLFMKGNRHLMDDSEQ